MRRFFSLDSGTGGPVAEDPAESGLGDDLPDAVLFGVGEPGP